MKANKQRTYDHNFSIIQRYVESRALAVHKYNEGIHIRVIGAVAVVDFWPSTGKYYVKDTSYSEAGWRMVEKAGEKGFMSEHYKNFESDFDAIFFAGDVADRLATSTPVTPHQSGADRYKRWNMLSKELQDLCQHDTLVSAYVQRFLMGEIDLSEMLQKLVVHLSKDRKDMLSKLVEMSNMSVVDIPKGWT